MKAFTLLLLIGVAASQGARAENPDGASPETAVATMNARVQLFRDYKEWCLAKIISDPKLTGNVLRAGNWSLDHSCECASAVTVSRMNADQVRSAHQSYNVPTWNAALSTNMVTCLHIQP